MRIGIDLRSVADPGRRLDLAVEADRLGLWAVLIGATSGTEAIEAATIAMRTSSVHLAVVLDASSEQASTLAEEVSVLDHLSARRAIAVVDGEPAVVDHVDRLLAGHIVDGVALSPPPAQTRVPVLAANGLARLELTGDLDHDAGAVDGARDDGCTHVFVTWPGELRVLARHLATRAVGPDFPSIVADLADVIDP